MYIFVTFGIHASYATWIYEYIGGRNTYQWIRTFRYIIHMWVGQSTSWRLYLIVESCCFRDCEGRGLNKRRQWKVRRKVTRKLFGIEARRGIVVEVCGSRIYHRVKRSVYVRGFIVLERGRLRSRTEVLELEFTHHDPSRDGSGA